MSNGPITPPTVLALRAALEIRRQHPVETEEDLKRKANERLAELRRRVVSPTSDRGRRQTDGLQMCIYHRHRQTHELRSSGLTQPVRNRPIDQEEQGVRRDFRRPYRGDAVSCSGQAYDSLEDFSQHSVSAQLAYEHRLHLIDVLAAHPQDRENAAALEIGFERLQPFTYRIRLCLPKI